MVCTKSALIYYQSFTNDVHPMCTSSALCLTLSSVFTVASVCSLAGRFESYLVKPPRTGFLVTWLLCTLVIVSQKSSGTRFASNNFRKMTLKYKQKIFFNLKLFPWNIEEHYTQDVSLILRSSQNDLTCYPLWCNAYYETSNTLAPSWVEFKTIFDRLNVLLSCCQH